MQVDSDQSSPDIQHLLLSDLSVLEFISRDLPSYVPETVFEIQKKWNMAVKNLKTSIDKNKNSEALQQAFDTLSRLHWTGQLQPFHIIDLHQLSTFFTADWLTDDHELVMLNALKEDLVIVGKADESYIENTAFMILLGNAYRDQNYTEKSCEWLRKRGNALKNGEKRYLSMIANRGGVHWVAIILDFDKKYLYYGDSFGTNILAEHHKIIDWWTEYHAGVRFTLHTLPTAQQLDNFSCGIFAWDALRLFYGLEKSLMDPRYPFECRAKVFLHLSNYYRVSVKLYIIEWPHSYQQSS